MTRRALLLAACAVRLRADAADDAWEVIASLAAALVNGNAADFMGAFDPEMPGYNQLYAYITALVREFVAQSSIDPVKNEGDDRTRTLVLDWRLHLVDQQNDAAATHREQNVTCGLVKKGRKWRIAALDPLSFFEPPAAPPAARN
jgi:hypothetical protein